jgi:hypothetical protein
MCWSYMMFLYCMVIGETYQIVKTWHSDIHLTMPVDHKNEVMAMWKVSGWHISYTVNVWTKYDEPRLYSNRETDLMKTWLKFNT